MKRNHRHAALIQQGLDDDSLIVEAMTGAGNWASASWLQARLWKHNPVLWLMARL